MNANAINANEEKIQAWLDANPNTRITEQVLLEILSVGSLHDADLEDADLWNADLTNVNLTGANLMGADLTGADLTGADLTNAKLWDANLKDANLWGTNLRDAYMADANLTKANLMDAHLRGVNLWGADLTSANLLGANLMDADLTNANLTDADLTGANLTYSTGGVAQINNLYPYPATLQPTPNGWYVRLQPTLSGWYVLASGWCGPLEELREITTSNNDDDWPEALGEECERRRPLLQAILSVFDAHVANHPDIINELNDLWRNQA